MAIGRCDECGERFTSKSNFELHKELGKCEPPEKKTSEASSKEVTRTISDGNKISGAEGTVAHFDDEGGYGFLTTVDLAGKLVEDKTQTQDVFFHISDIDSSWVEEGDRLRCDVVEDDEGLRCENIQILIRDNDRDSYDNPADGKSKTGFGHQKDDTQYGTGRKPSPSERDIESFKDERKFR